MKHKKIPRWKDGKMKRPAPGHKLLALDTASATLVVALVENGTLCWSAEETGAVHHGERVLPLINEGLVTCGWRLEDLKACAVTCGPGSFTGVRVGIATVKGIAMAGGKHLDLMGLSSLDVIAAHIKEEGTVAILTDARRERMYSAWYSVRGSVSRKHGKDAVITYEEAVRQLRTLSTKRGTGPLMVSGDALRTYGERLQHDVGTICTFCNEANWGAHAPGLATVAWRAFERKAFVEVCNLNARYLRLTPPEEALLNKRKKKN